MSTASISYSSLKDASNEAKAVAKKLDKYADSLYSNVYKKLNKYDGSWNSNVSTASSKTNAKISELRSEQSRYETYATDLIDLRDECKEVDKAVKSKVSSLTASFKEAHGIRNSKVENAISYFFTGLGNETAFGRWLGGKKDDASSTFNYFKDSIKEWYNYEGGKELITGVLVGLLEVAIGVLAIVGAILSGGALLVIIAGVVGGIIAVANGIANIWNEQKAYSSTKNGDPATGRRRSEVNTWQDYLRSSFAFGDSGENYEYNEFYNGLATGIDIVNLACTVVTVVSSAGKLIKNGYKWATGNAAKVKDITLKQVFSKDTFTAFKGKFLDIKAAFKANGWQAAKDLGGQILKDFGRNFKSEFFNFKNTNGSFNWKGAVSSIKNMLSIPKGLLKDGFTLSNIFDVGFSSIILPSITAFTVESVDGTIIKGADGQFQFDFTDKVNVKTITGLFEKGGKIWDSTTSLFSSDSVVGGDVLGKLSSACNINISVPEIYIPDIEMPVMRAA